MVADKGEALHGPGEGKMVCGMSGRRHRLEPPAGSLDHVAMCHGDVGPEISVGAGLRIVLLALEPRARGPMRPLCVNRGAGRRLDPGGVRRMVAMSMRYQYVCHRLATHGIEQCGSVRLIVGTWVDDRNIALADDIADRPGKGERARIVAQDAPHARPHFLDDTGLEGEVAV